MPRPAGERALGVAGGGEALGDDREAGRPPRRGDHDLDQPVQRRLGLRLRHLEHDLVMNVEDHR